MGIFAQAERLIVTLPMVVIVAAVTFGASEGAQPAPGSGTAMPSSAESGAPPPSKQPDPPRDFAEAVDRVVALLRGGPAGARATQSYDAAVRDALRLMSTESAKSTEAGAETRPAGEVTPASAPSIDAAADPLRVRVEWILTQRAAHPELFETLWTLIARAAAALPQPSPYRDQRVSPRDLGVLPPELLHPHTRALAADYPVAVAAVREEYLRFSERHVSSSRAESAAEGRALDNFRSRLAEIGDEHEVPRDAMSAVCEVAGYQSGWPICLDPAYQPAWEEALLRPDVPWSLRAPLAQFVPLFDDAASSPVLGEVARQAAMCNDPRSKEKDLFWSAWLSATRALVAHPSAVAAHELTRLPPLQSASPEEQTPRRAPRAAHRMGVDSIVLGAWLYNADHAAAWRTYLEDARSDPARRADAEFLLGAIAEFRVLLHDTEAPKATATERAAETQPAAESQRATERQP